MKKKYFLPFTLLFLFSVLSFNLKEKVELKIQIPIEIQKKKMKIVELTIRGNNLPAIQSECLNYQFKKDVVLRCEENYVKRRILDCVKKSNIKTLHFSIIAAEKPDEILVNILIE